YEARQKYLRDVSTIKSVSHDEGYAEGEAKGLEKGLVQGEAKGRAEGKAEGVNENRYAVAKVMKANGEPTQKIQQYTGLSAEEIEKL
ncbi:MAG: hypothetical protein JXX29_16225, partial [Deltaproteobacteria bacterium]|nr:hypothetical protein [Deltaproteobacteria bacterium]